MSPGHGVDGSVIRGIRLRAGMTQADIAGLLGVSRATVTNMEAGRQSISPAQVQALRDALPEWASEMIRGVEPPPSDDDNASLAIDELTIAYVFEASRSPSEILQIRRIRALRAGVSRYSLGVRRSGGETFEVETHALWGGFLDETPDAGGEGTVISVHFGRALRRGEVHEIATRSWVHRDADPDTEIWLTVTIPTARASVHLAFTGGRGVRKAWTYVVDEPGEHTPLPIGLDSGVTLTVERPVPERTYALAWEW